MTNSTRTFAACLASVEREAWNRASHSDALPEMQMVPAEEMQLVEHPMTNAFPWRLAVPMALGLLFILTIVGARA